VTRADVLFQWYAAAQTLPSVIASSTRPIHLVGLPAGPGTDYAGYLASQGSFPLRTLAMQACGGDLPYRIGLLGFSHGCQGVRAALQTQDAALVDVVVCVDGIHADWTNRAKGWFNGDQIAPFKAVADRAANGMGSFVISTSAIVPPSYVSTTDTSHWIWQNVMGSTEDVFDVPAPDSVWDAPISPPFVSKSVSGSRPVSYSLIPWVRYRKHQGLVIYNATDLDPNGYADHQLQAAVALPRLVQAYVVNRWSAMDPSMTMCSG
jgi:hypothetical protein